MTDAARMHGCDVLAMRALSCGRAAVLTCLIACGLACAAAPVRAQSVNQPLSDEAALAALLRGAAQESAAKIAAHDISVRVTPADAHPMVLQVFSEVFGAQGASVSSSPGGGTRVTLDARELSMSAVSLGKTSYLRNLNAVIGVLAESPDGTIRWSKEFALARTDTLSGAPSEAHHEYRTEGSASWLDGILVPVVIASAAVVVAVLLFTVRGS